MINNKLESKIRINKFLAASGFGSRRGVEELVNAKKVMINGKIAKLSDRVDPKKDDVKVLGKAIKLESEHIYYAVNKPVGYTSTVRDTYADKTVIDLVPKVPRVYPVGRLDKNSHGLIIITNDGDLAHRLTHPSFQHEKEYQIEVQITNKKSPKNLKLRISKLRQGVRLEEGLAKFDKLETINISKTEDRAEIKLTLHQGWKRQIRRMCEKVGLDVFDLKRTRIGKFKLDNLKEGEYKIISKSELI